MKNTTTSTRKTTVEKGYLIHLDTIGRPFLVPRYTRERTTEKVSVHSATDEDRELLTLFTLFCLAQKSWGVPIRDARLLFFMAPEEYKSSCHPSAMSTFLKLRLIEQCGLKMFATPALRKTVFLSLKETAIEKDVRYTFEPLHVIGERGLAGNCAHLHGRMYYYPVEALEAYIRFAPIWKVHEKYHASKIRYAAQIANRSY